MKQTIKTFMFAMALTMASGATFAQSNSQNGNRPSPETMMEQRANNIAKQMGLDAKTTKKFVSVFKSEQNDMRELMPQRGKSQKGDRPQGNPPQGNPPSMNGNGGKGGPQMSDEDKQKMTKIKEKYNKKYAKFFSQDQISQMYKLQEQERSNHQSKNWRQ